MQSSSISQMVQSNPVPGSLRSLTVMEAAEKSPEINNLMHRMAQAQARLEVILPLLPKALRPIVHLGVLDEESWCLLVPHSSAAAKLRNLAPSINALLEEKGQPALKLRIEILK